MRIFIVILLCFTLFTINCDPSDENNEDILTINYDDSLLQVHREISFITDTDSNDTYAWSYKRASDEDYYTVPDIDNSKIDLYFVKSGIYDIKVINSLGYTGMTRVKITDRIVDTSEYEIKHSFESQGNGEYKVSTLFDIDIHNIINDETNQCLDLSMILWTVENKHVLNGLYRYTEGPPKAVHTMNINSLFGIIPDNIPNPVVNGDVLLDNLKACYFIDCQIVGIEDDDDIINRYYANDAYAIVLYDEIPAFEVYY